MPAESRSRDRVARLAWLALATASLAVLVLAAWLEPDARGYGTHGQLGLPPCGFRWLTGVACPGCGLTTAFAHAIRGDWALGFAANPLGLVLFGAVCACVPLALVAAMRGWSFSAVVDRFAVGRWALGVAGSAALSWLARLADVL